MLSLRSLSKRFGGVVAVDRVSLEIAAGEVHALIGPNGAGKTTLIHVISGSLSCDEGQIAFQGSELTRKKPHERVAAGLARSYQITSIFRRFSVLENLALATRPKLLLLDEPMAGMGPDESRRMIALIGRIRAGVTVLLVEHDMDAVFRLADRVSVLVNGRVLATGRPEEIRADPSVRRAYLGDELGDALGDGLAA